MSSFKTILYPTDLSKAALRGFTWIAELASWHEAAVHVLHVIPTSPLYEPADYGIHDLSSTREDAFFKLLERRLPDQLRAAGALSKTVRVGYSITEEIMRYADEHKVDLIAMGTHGHRSIIHPSLGGTTGGVLRRANCPVLTWRVDSDDAENIPALPRHILAPVDFSPHSEKTLEMARRWAAHYGAKLSVLFVAEQRIVPIFNDTLIPSIHVVKLEKDQIERAGQALAQLLRKKQGPAVEIATQVRTGQAASEILAYIDENEVDLVMMSSHGLTGSSLFSMGSTSEKVVRKASCAVLTDKVKFDGSTS